MRVFVAGATGVIGRRAVSALVAAGHDVTAVVRTPAKAELVRSLGATPVEVSIFDPAALRGAVAGHDAVCNLATHIPPLTRAAEPRSWDENNRIRTDGSRNLVDAALAAGATLIGVNHRDLKTFTIDMTLTAQIAPRVPADVVLVGESGIRTRDDIDALGNVGVHAVLVGEHLMRAASPGDALLALRGGSAGSR